MAEVENRSSATRDDDGWIGFMVQRPVTANLLMLFCLVGGLIMAFRIRQEVFPEFNLDVVTVTVPYPGASPEEVERGIVEAVEEAVRGLDGVKRVTSTAAENVGVVAVELLEGADPNKALQDIRNAVNAITSFPEDAEEPRISLASNRREVVSLILYGDIPRRMLRALAERARDDLLAYKGITLVDLHGVRPVEISIEIPQDVLRKYGLTLQSVADIVRASARELPGGGVRTRTGEILLRVEERRDWGRQFHDIPVVTRADGTRVLLGDIAKIRDGFAETDDAAWFNGKPAIMLRVYRTGDQTPMEVSRIVHAYAERLQTELPPAVRAAVWQDMSEIYGQRLRLLLKNAAAGLVLVLLLLGVFLESRLAFWVAMGIPTSFLGSLVFLPAAGVSINMVSLFAFIIALGIVVDDAIVVGENVYKLRQDGMPFVQAAVTGARQMVVPVVFSVATNIVAFVPMFFVPGFIGKIFKTIPIVVITVFTLSLAEALFILPAHLGHVKKLKERGVYGILTGIQRRADGLLDWVITVPYQKLARSVLRHRYIAASVAVAVLLAVFAYVKSGRISVIAIPRVESDVAGANVTLPFGSSAEETRAILDRLTAAAQRTLQRFGGDRYCRGVYARVGAFPVGGGPRGGGGGGGQSHLGGVQVFFVGADQRPFGTGAFVKEWREETGVVPGVESLTFRADIGGPRAGQAVNIQLAHTDIHVLHQAASLLAQRIAEIQGVRDVDDGFSPGKRQWNFKVRPEGRAFGLTAMGIGRQVRNAYYGAEAFRLQRGRNEVKVMVRYPKTDRHTMESVEDFILRTPTGGEVPLREAANVIPGRAYTSIQRVDGRRVVNVTADVVPRSLVTPVLSTIVQSVLPEVLSRYPGLTYSLEGERRDLRDSMQALAKGFLVALAAIFAMLVIPFESYVQPLIVMTSIPFGIVGAVVGHVLMGFNLSIISMMGIVALAGVVVNDALVLIDYINELTRRRRVNPFDAVLEAGMRRFRPILLTSLTTFFGLMPMIFAKSVQARFLIPMAISLGYGILFATGITLLLVPCLYLMIEDARRLWRWVCS